ncbi:MAG: FHA domain-containing protein, partial [Anaerolineales bacterium]
CKEGACGRISAVNRIRLPVVFILISIVSLLPFRSAAGAEGDAAFLFDLDNSQFPQIHAYLSLSNPLGGRLAGLAVEDISLKEDDVPARNVVLTEEQTGLRLVVVVDPGLDLTYALPDGETRIQRLRRAMTDWLGTFPQKGMDDLTLITPEGISVSHTSDAEAFLESLRAYTPKLPAERTLDALLMDALGAAADPLPRPGMRALLILFSASRLAQNENIGRGMCPRARELHATLFGIWSGRTEPSAKGDMDSLASLAAECGGYSVALESATGTAAVLGMIATQRSQYRVEYRSSIASSGEHALRAAVARADFTAEAAPLRFSVAVQPPVVTWIDFPERMTRKGDDVAQPVEGYPPLSVELRAEVAFPDGHPREIAVMQLFADNELVGECASACGGIRWDLRPYAESASIRLRMVVRDELGLEGKTAERTFALTVARPSFWEIFRAKYLLPVTVLLAAAAAVGVFIAAMVNLNRVRAAPAAGELLFPGESSAPDRPMEGLRQRLRRIGRRKPKPPEPPAEAYAVLEKLGGTEGRIEITAPDVIIGRDPQSAGIVLDDLSVSPRHGRIVRMGDGRPWVFDLGSAAGSWKNFEEVPPEGASLREGDRLNFGRAAFRVRLMPLAPAKETHDGKNP